MKMKNLLVLFLAPLLSLKAQVAEMVPYHQGDKWGYSDNTGKVIVEPVFEAAEVFSDGYASVMQFGKWGCIDKMGKIVIAPSFAQSLTFNYGFSIARNDAGLYGLVDKTSKAIIPFKYTELSCGAVDLNGVADYSQNIYEAVLDGNHGFIDSKNKTIIPLKYRGAQKFTAGIAWCLKGYKYGAIDKNGKTLGSFKYTSGGPFKNGLAAVYTSEEHNIKYGFMNPAADEIIPLKYKYAGNFEGGLAEVQIDDKFGFINPSGAEIIPIKYEQVTPFISKYGFAGYKLNGKFGLIDSAGKELFPAEFDNVQATTDGIFVSKSGKWAMVNRSGKLTGFKFSEVSGFADDLACVRANAKYGFINRNGETVIPFIYSSNANFINGFCAIKFQGKYGVINKAGKTVIPFNYDNVVYAGNGLYDVTLSDNYNAFIDVNGMKYFDKAQVPAPTGMLVKNIWSDNIKFENGIQKFANVYVPEKGLYILSSKHNSKRSLVKYDDTGTKLMEKNLDSLAGLPDTEIMLDRSLNIINWGNKSLSVKESKEGDVFSITKTDTNSKMIWKKEIKNIHILSSACDQVGNIFVAGFLTGDLSAEGIVIKKANKMVSGLPTALLVIKLSPAGKILWAKENKTDLPFGSVLAAVSAEGKLVVSGSSDPVSGMQSSAILYSFDPSGKMIFGKQFKTGNESKQTEFTSLLNDKDGNVYLCGSTNDLVNFNPGAQAAEPGSVYSFFAKYDMTGKHVYISNFKNSFPEELPTNLKLAGITADEVVILAKPVVLKVNIKTLLVQKFELSAAAKSEEEILSNDVIDFFPLFSYNGQNETLVKVSATTYGSTNPSSLLYVVKQKLVR